MPIAATPNHHYHYPSLQNYTGRVKVSHNTSNNQNIFQDHQRCSKTITNFPGYSVLVPRTIIAISHPSGLILPSQSIPDHSRWPGLIPGLTTVPGRPLLLLSTSFLSQPLQTICAITWTHHGPLKASQSLNDWASPLQNHQLCSRFTQTNPGYSCISQPLRLSLSSSITPELPTSPIPLKTTRTHSRTTNTVANQPRTFLATPDITQPVQTTKAITPHFKTTMDQSKPHRPFQTFQILLAFSLIRTALLESLHKSLSSGRLALYATESISKLLQLLSR